MKLKDFIEFSIRHFDLNENLFIMNVDKNTYHSVFFSYDENFGIILPIYDNKNIKYKQCKTYKEIKRIDLFNYKRGTKDERSKNCSDCDYTKQRESRRRIKQNNS